MENEFLSFVSALQLQLLCLSPTITFLNAALQLHLTSPRCSRSFKWKIILRNQYTGAGFAHCYWHIIIIIFFVSFCFITKWISYRYTHVPISPPSRISLPPTLPIPPPKAVTKHRADLPVLCGCFSLAIYFTFGSVYMSMTLSHPVTSHPSPSPYPQVHSLVGLCLATDILLPIGISGGRDTE